MMLFLRLYPLLQLIPHVVFLGADAQNQLLMFLILIKQPEKQLPAVTTNVSTL